MCQPTWYRLKQWMLEKPVMHTSLRTGQTAGGTRQCLQCCLGDLLVLDAAPRLGPVSLQKLNTEHHSEVQADLKEDHACHQIWRGSQTGITQFSSIPQAYMVTSRSDDCCKVHRTIAIFAPGCPVHANLLRQRMRLQPWPDAWRTICAKLRQPIKAPHTLMHPGAFDTLIT